MLLPWKYWTTYCEVLKTVKFFWMKAIIFRREKTFGQIHVCLIVVPLRMLTFFLVIRFHYRCWEEIVTISAVIAFILKNLSLSKKKKKIKYLVFKNKWFSEKLWEPKGCSFAHLFDVSPVTQTSVHRATVVQFTSVVHTVVLHMYNELFFILAAQYCFLKLLGDYDANIVLIKLPMTLLISE